jgi:hypothetical protein
VSQTKSPCLLVLTNANPLGNVIFDLAKNGLGADARIFRMTYSDCVTQLSRELIEETDLFVVELFREYPGGLRAEGVFLAERMVRRGKRALIISAVFLAQQLGCHSYWDVSSTDTLIARIIDRLMATRPQLVEFERLSNVFAAWLEIPSQHET